MAKLLVNLRFQFSANFAKERKEKVPEKEQQDVCERTEFGVPG